MKLQKVIQAASARGMYFDGERGYSAFYCILTPDGYFYTDSLRNVYRRVMQYRKENNRITFRK